MHPFRYIWQPFYTIYVALSFIVGILLMFPFVVLFSIPNTPLARRFIYYVLNTGGTLWLAAIGMPPLWRGKKPKPGRYVVIGNHISYIDAVLLFPSMPGYFRPLGKIEIAKVPIFGYMYKQITVLVDRSSAESRAKSMTLMLKTIQEQCHLFIFPEGTFNMTREPMKDLYDGAFKIAIEAQVPLLPVLFPDTIKRHDYRRWWKFSPGKNRMVYLPAVETKGLTLEDVEDLKARVKKLMADGLAPYGYPYWDELNAETSEPVEVVKKIKS